MRAGARAGLVAGVVSGMPSTLVTRRPVVATRAAGALLGRTTITRGVAAHIAISVGWGIALTRVLGRQPPVVAGVAAGVAIGALDLGVVGRRIPEISRLPFFPQLLDHAAYGATVAWYLRHSH